MYTEGGWCTYALSGIHKHCPFFSFPDCKYTVHQRCVSKNIPGCVKTYSKAKRSGEVGDTDGLILLHAASGLGGNTSTIIDPCAERTSESFLWLLLCLEDLKPSHSSINPFSISLKLTVCSVLYQGHEKQYPVFSNSAQVRT